MLRITVYEYKLQDWLKRNPGDGPLYRTDALREGAWLLWDALRPEGALRPYAQILGGEPNAS